MSRVHVATKIKAPVDRVWKTVMNPDCLKDWVTIHRSVGAVSSRPLHEGSTMDQVLQLRGVSFRVHWTLVEVNHGKGYVTRYAHNERTLVNVGETVTRGQPIALMGSTGRSTGPHVHFEVLRNGRQVNPLSFTGK